MHKPQIRAISAITLGTANMGAALDFYQRLGFELRYGGANAAFSSLAAGPSCLNLTTEAAPPGGWWGRVIFYVDDVDGLHAAACANGLTPSFAPTDGSWGERHFHISDPDGHELSFAWPLGEAEGRQKLLTDPALVDFTDKRV